MLCEKCENHLPVNLYQLNCESCGSITLVLVQADFAGELTWLCHECQDSSVLEENYEAVSAVQR